MLPGSIYIFSAFISIVSLLGCLTLAFITGSAAFWASKWLVERTKAYSRFEQGFKDSNRWWFNTRAWAGCTMFGSFVVYIAYDVGFVILLIKKMGGILS